MCRSPFETGGTVETATRQTNRCPLKKTQKLVQLRSWEQKPSIAGLFVSETSHLLRRSLAKKEAMDGKFANITHCFSQPESLRA